MPKPFAALAILMLIAVSACSLAPPPSTQAGATPAVAARATDSLIAFTSGRAPSAIANCLTDRVHGVHRTAAGSATQLSVGSDAWVITLTPAGGGTTVNVRKSADDEAISEPEMRFHIARCVV